VLGLGRTTLGLWRKVTGSLTGSSTQTRECESMPSQHLDLVRFGQLAEPPASLVTVCALQPNAGSEAASTRKTPWSTATTSRLTPALSPSKSGRYWQPGNQTMSRRGPTLCTQRRNLACGQGRQGGKEDDEQGASLRSIVSTQRSGRNCLSHHNCIDVYTAEFPYIDYASSICLDDAADAPGIDHHEQETS
jgi:hypothetical protein